MVSFRMIKWEECLASHPDVESPNETPLEPAGIVYSLRSLSTLYLVPEMSAEAIRPDSVIW
jgi:hypothetical protein